MAKLDGTYIIIGGKVVKDEKKAEAKLDLCTRLKRRTSKKIKVVKPCKTMTK